MTRACSLTLALWLFAASGVTAQPPPKPDYRGTGVVLAILPPPSNLHATRPVIVIDHEPIEGLMAEKMSMPFIAASTAIFQGLTPGDRIAFGLKDTPDALLVIAVERLAKKR
jgi:hypothetical protein